MFLNNFINLCGLFLIYSFGGWCVEVIKTLITKKKFINRGFLIGPIVPIWGIGAALITLIINPNDNIPNVILWAAFIGTVLEYVVQYLMEKLFQARWWDYSKVPFNINGRICLSSSIFFGLGGFIVIKITNPYIFNLFDKIDNNIFTIIVIILMMIVLIDFCVSCNIIQKLKLSTEAMRKDSTEEISRKVMKVLMDKSLGFRRILKAYPNISFKKK